MRAQPFACGQDGRAEQLEIVDLGDLAPGFDILACGRSDTIRIELGDEEARPAG